MTTPNHFPIATKARETVDFIVYEESSPNGRTRGVAPMPDDLTKVKGLKIGVLVDTDCLPVTFVAITDSSGNVTGIETPASAIAAAKPGGKHIQAADSVAGISLQAVSQLTGLTEQYNDVGLAYLKKASPRLPIEIKDTILEVACEAAVDSSVKDDAVITAIQVAVYNLIHNNWSVITCGL